LTPRCNDTCATTLGPAWWYDFIGGGVVDDGQSQSYLSFLTD
jgi:hypothetical protein